MRSENGTSSAMQTTKILLWSLLTQFYMLFIYFPTFISDVFNQNLVFGHSDDVNALQPFFKKIAIAISGNLKTRCR